MARSVWQHVFIKHDGKTDKIYYIVHTQYKFFSQIYRKWVHCHVGMRSDGATGALDIKSFSWLVHDKLCLTGEWSDGTPCTNWQASNIISEILGDDGRWFRKYTWLIGTFFFGGKEIKKKSGWW